MRMHVPSRLSLDAVASLWAAQKFIPGADAAEVVFSPSRLPGDAVKPGDLALAIRAGGRGLVRRPRPDGSEESSFAQIVEQYATRADQRALSSLVELVNASSPGGSAVRRIAPAIDRHQEQVLTDTGLIGVFAALDHRRAGVSQARANARVVHYLSLLFDGMLEVGRDRLLAEAEADRAELSACRRVAILRASTAQATTRILAGRGVQVIVYQDGHDLGVMRQPGVALRLDHPVLLRIIADAGERVGRGAQHWFLHPEGGLLAHGTRDHPAGDPPGLRPRPSPRLSRDCSPTATSGERDSRAVGVASRVKQQLASKAGDHDTHA